MDEAVVQETRKWLGTPFMHQARCMGVGVDCGQLVIAVGVSLGRFPEPPKHLMRYGRNPNPRHMRRLIASMLQPIECEPEIGDVLWVGEREGLPMHLAIVTDKGVIHSDFHFGKVVECSRPANWDKLLECAWRYPRG